MRKLFMLTPFFKKKKKSAAFKHVFGKSTIQLHARLCIIDIVWDLFYFYNDSELNLKLN